MSCGAAKQITGRPAGLKQTRGKIISKVEFMPGGIIGPGRGRGVIGKTPWRDAPQGFVGRENDLLRLSAAAQEREQADTAEESGGGFRDEGDRKYL